MSFNIDVIEYIVNISVTVNDDELDYKLTLVCTKRFGYVSATDCIHCYGDKTRLRAVPHDQTVLIG